jgi:predicted transcriptional regulator of viral defense system
MESISSYDVIQKLNEKAINLIGINDVRKIFGLENDNTLYKFVQRLEKKGILKRIIHGKYLFSLNRPSEFEIANFITDPSYISLESALSFYGILSQFPYVITSITTARSNKRIFEDKEYEFIHLDRKYYFGFVKNGDFLIATPEKALIDQLYLVSKSLRNFLPSSELDLKMINKRYFKRLLNEYNCIPLKKLAGEYVR